MTQSALSACALIALTFGCAGVSRPATGILRETALAIARVRVEPKTIDLSTDQQAVVIYTLTKPAEMRLEVVDADGRVVRTIDGGLQGVGEQRLAWDGRAQTGAPVSSGAYRYVLIARDRDSGMIAVHDPSTDTGGEELTIVDFTFDRRTGHLAWVMPKAGYAWLRVGLQGFPHLRTLLDWMPIEGGRHTIDWDGLDASGLLRIKDHPQLVPKLTAFALPDNAVLVRSIEPAAALDGPASYPSLARRGAQFHAKHPRAICHEVRLRVEFPEASARSAQGRPILRGAAPVRITLDPRDAEHLVNTRYEVMLYEDLVALFEDEESTNPFTFIWDTTRLGPGEHLLTVNILSYDDHYGVATVPVAIER